MTNVPLIKNGEPIAISYITRSAPETVPLQTMIFVWLVFGLFILYSASLPQSIQDFQDPFYFFGRQLSWVGLGLIGFWLTLRTPLNFWWRWSPIIFFGVFGLVIATQVFGNNLNGAERWLTLGPIRFQPSEFAKPALVLQTVWVLDRWHRLRPLSRLVWCLALVGMIAAVLFQPSLSMALLLAIVLWLLAFAANFPLRWLLGSVLVAGGGLAYKISQTGYQTERFRAFLDPFADPQGSGYQIVQSLLAINAGSLWGTGFGLSLQKTAYLPYAYSDFVFSIFIEEFGLAGGIAFLIFLTVFALLGLRLSLRFSAPRSVRLLALGTMLLLVVQSLLHLAVVSGCLPPTGMPLPLVSAGGSGLCAALFTCGLLVRASREAGQVQVEIPQRLQ